MCDQTEIQYADGEIVWVKLGPCWWPGEVVGAERVPPGILKSLRKIPVAVVKFFQEETFEYVKNISFIYRYDCSKKNEFIQKGLDLYRSKHSHMEKFPEDVAMAEQRTDGDPDIITSEQFLPKKKESYANIFGSPNDSSVTKKQGLGRRGRPPGSSLKVKSRTSPKSAFTPKITHPRILQKYEKGTSDYKMHILVQPTGSVTPITPVYAESESDKSEDSKSLDIGTPLNSTPGMYSCHACNFTTSRLNVLLLHNKYHSANIVPYTPVKSKKSSVSKVKSKSVPITSPNDDFNFSSDTKKKNVKLGGKPRGRPRKILENLSTLPLKNVEEVNISPPKRKLGKNNEKEVKKPKTDVEIKNSLLADWNEESDEESMDIFTSLKLSEKQTKSEEKDVENDIYKSKIEANSSSKDNSSNEDSDQNLNKAFNNSSFLGKREQVSCFDFEEDEDLEIESIGRKIPRLSNSKSEEISKKIDSSDKVLSNKESVNLGDKLLSSGETETNKIDTSDLDSEINTLLKETAVPDLPLMPSTNFQKSKIAKAPDKEKNDETQPVKSIFKTKTFFRSRHSRSQDAIEKYVIDNTSNDKPLTYMEKSLDSVDTNLETKDDIVSVSEKSNDNEQCVSPKVESVRVTKFAPKIQLKKMSAALINRNKPVQFADSVDAQSIDISCNLKLDLIDQSKRKETSLNASIESEFSKELKEEIGNASSNEKELNVKRIEDVGSSKNHEITNENIKVIKIDKSSDITKTSIQMSEQHESEFVQPLMEKINKDMKKDADKEIKEKIAVKTDKIIDKSTNSSNQTCTESSKVQLLDDKQKPKSPLKILSTKIIKPQYGREKILNFDVNSSQSKLNTSPQKQKIIIRRKAAPSMIDSLESDDFENNVQTFTIESGISDDLNEPQLRKVNKPFQSKQNVTTKAHSAIITSTGEIIQADSVKHSSTDVDLMPIVLSDEVVMSEKSDITTSKSQASQSVAQHKVENVYEGVKTAVDQPFKKSIVVKPVVEKFASPNILSKSGKGKTVKHLLVVGKNSGERKIIMGNAENVNDKQVLYAETIGKQVPKEKVIINTKLPFNKKLQRIILSPATKNRIVANIAEDTDNHDVYASSTLKTNNTAKIIQSKPDSSTNNTIMIITNPQGVQSKIILTPEHQKILFPKSKNLQSVTPQTIVSSKNIASTSVSTKTKPSQSVVITSGQLLNSELCNIQSLTTPLITQTQTLQGAVKQKGTILNSKGQAIITGNTNKRTLLTTMPGHAILTSRGQLIAPQATMITTASKLVSSPNKNTFLSSSNQQTRQLKINQIEKEISKRADQSIKTEKTQIIKGTSSTILLKGGKVISTNENTVPLTQVKDSPVIISQKPGTVMHYLTPAQFEHFQRTGQIISTPQSKIASGKVTQKYILQKYIGSKQSVPNYESTEDSGGNIESSQIQTVFTSDMPSLSSIHVDESTVKKKYSQEIVAHKTEEVNKIIHISESTSNLLSDIDDSNLYDNLDKLIPATIISKKDSVGKRELIVSQTECGSSNIIDNVTSMANKNSLQDSEKTDETQQSQATNTLTDPQKQLLAIPGENFGGPPNSFFLCVEENGVLTPIDNQPLVLENNQLVPMVISAPTISETPIEESKVLMSTNVDLLKTSSSSQHVPSSQVMELPLENTTQNILINMGDQQILVDHQTLLSLLAGDGQNLVTSDGQQLVFQGNTQQILSALASNPDLANLLSSGQQVLLNSAEANVQQTIAADENQIVIAPQNESYTFQSSVQGNVSQDILAAALASTEVFQQDTLIQDSINIATTSDGVLLEIDSLSPNVQNLNTTHTVHSNVFETSSTLNQPIMSPLEIPTKKRSDDKTVSSGLLSISNDPQITPTNLEDSLAVIGVSTATIPTSLELPITVTNPRIAAKTSPINLSCGNVYQSPGLINMVSPSITLYEPETQTNTPGLTDLSQNKESIDITEQIVSSPARKNVLTNIEKSLQNDLVCKPIQDCMQLSDNDETNGSIKIMTKAADKYIENTDELDKGNSSIVASSMPCLDDSSSESFSETPDNQSSIDNQTKTYSPISMPILTEDILESCTLDSNKIESNIPELSPHISSSTDSVIESPQIDSQTGDIDVKSMPKIMDHRKDASDDNGLDNSIEKEKTNIDTDIPSQIFDSKTSDKTLDLVFTDKAITADNEKENKTGNSTEYDENINVEGCNTNSTEKIENKTISVNNEYKEEVSTEVQNSNDKDMPLIISTDSTEVCKEFESDKCIESNNITENDDICADTPPHVSEHDTSSDMIEHDTPPPTIESMTFDDVPINEADGNSLQDEISDDLNVSSSSILVAPPDSTSSDLDKMYNSPDPELGDRLVFTDPTSPDLDKMSNSPDPELGDRLVFTESDSNDSTEIPIQPIISVSQHLVQNLSTALDKKDSEPTEHIDNKSNDSSEHLEDIESAKETNIGNQR